MSAATSCPQPKLLKQLLLGELPPPIADALAEHLEQCDHCATLASKIHSESALVHAVRSIDTAWSCEEETFVAELIEKTAALIRKDSLPSQPTAASPQSLPDEYRGLLSPAQQADELGRLGHYRILKVLGSGGMGIVFLAEDLGLERRVALKVIKPELSSNADVRERFLREARAAAAIEDEHIVTIHQVGEERGIPFIAMQLLQGRSLQDRLREAAITRKSEALPLSEALRIAIEVAQGLASAHARALIHRDITPANIWLEGYGPKDRPAARAAADEWFRRVKLLDFGLAHELDKDVLLTRGRDIAGTPAYLAPEQITGLAVDERCDLFSLGCVLYEMTTGRSPFAGKDSAATLHAITGTNPESPHEINVEIPRELSNFIMQLLSKEPTRRPASAHEVVLRLQAIAKELPVQGLATAKVAAGRSSRFWAAIALGAVVLGGVSIATILSIRTDRGTLIIETSDDDIAVQVNEAGGVTLRDTKTGRTYHLQVGRHTMPAGQYEIEAQEQQTGIVLSAKQFTIREGELARLTATVERPGAQGGVDSSGQVASIPATEQVQQVADELRHLNPQFDGTLLPRVLDNSVVEVELNSDQLADLTPLSVFRDMQKLICRGSAPGKGVLENLAPLRRMTALQVLDISNNQVADLLPLQGMKLQTLIAANNPIEDLSALRGMPLEMLDLNGTFVADLQQLQTLPLKRLDIRATQVRETWPLEEVSTLRILDCYFRPKRDGATLRSMAFLRKLNGQDVEKFWEAVDARQKSLDEWLPNAIALPEEEKAQAVAEKLKELNPRFNGKVFPNYTDGKLTVFQAFTDNITDIEPLRALNHLERLTIRGTAQGNGKLFDLDPLRELPIVFLECGFNELCDLTSLQGTKVQVLLCRGTRIRDLSPLRELPIFYFECTSTPVVDLSPLAGMGISNLHIRNTQIRDFSPLTTFNLRVLGADLDPRRDEALLKSLPRLELLNDVPVTELWKQ